MSYDEELLTAMDRRFTASGECRSMPLSLALPAPAETKQDGLILRNAYDVRRIQRAPGVVLKRGRKRTAKQLACPHVSWWPNARQYDVAREKCAGCGITRVAREQEASRG